MLYTETVSNPLIAVPEEERLKMGITNGLLRVSVGIEEEADIVRDFMQALETAYGPEE